MARARSANATSGWNAPTATRGPQRAAQHVRRMDAAEMRHDRCQVVLEARRDARRSASSGTASSTIVRDCRASIGRIDRDERPRRHGRGLRRAVPGPPAGDGHALATPRPRQRERERHARAALLPTIPTGQHAERSRAERILRVYSDRQPTLDPRRAHPSGADPRLARPARTVEADPWQLPSRPDPFSARARLRVGDRDLTIYRLDRAGMADLDRRP